MKTGYRCSYLFSEKTKIKQAYSTFVEEMSRTLKQSIKEYLTKM